MKIDDALIDFDLTATNRGDLLSILEMAYEVGAIYNKQVKNQIYHTTNLTKMLKIPAYQPGSWFSIPL